MADGFEMLEEDHRKVDALFERYLRDNDDAVAREICEALTTLSEVEEAALYPALRRQVDGGDDLADRAVQEDSIVKTLIARFYDSPPESLLGLIGELRRDVEAHLQFVEAELFPAMREASVDAQGLGTAVEQARADAETHPAGA